MNAPKSELDLARVALAAAHGGFKQDHANRDVAAWYESLGETLWWIFALDDHYWNLDKTVYKPLRNSDEDGGLFIDDLPQPLSQVRHLRLSAMNNPHGYVIPGLRLARNRVGHGLALMLEDAAGHSPFLAPPPAKLTLDQLIWCRLEDLPPVEKDKESEAQEAAYQAHLAGNAARYALRHASRFFIQRRSELDSAIR
jgi:hypothetical protein